MLFSSEHYRELLMPRHRRLCELAHADDCDVIYHSDGDVSGAIPHLLECGTDYLHPLEVKAGVDVLELKQARGDRLALMGNTDARLLQDNNREALGAEIRAKIPEAMDRGRYVYQSDHSIPPGTRRDTYRFALDLVREVGGGD
jgi:uroporphyrinogen decarboxylase